MLKLWKKITILKLNNYIRLQSIDTIDSICLKRKKFFQLSF